MSPADPARRYRRASEIGAYVFCRRAWWLEHVQGHAAANVDARRRGVSAHAALGRRVHRAIRLRRLAVVVAAIALTVLLAEWWR